MMEESKYKQLPPEAVIAAAESFEKKNKELEIELEKIRKEKEEVLRMKNDIERKFEESKSIGGILVNKLYDIPKILETCGVPSDEIQDYSSFYQQQIDKGKPQIFLNTVNQKIASLSMTNLQSIENSQVDENGECLVKTLTEMSSFIDTYNKEDKISSEKFFKDYSQFIENFHTHKNMIEKWQNYIVIKNNLIEAQHHAFLIAQKSMNKTQDIMVEVEDQKENKKILELEEKISKIESSNEKLLLEIQKITNEKTRIQADIAKNELLESVATAKNTLESEGTQPDLPKPELPQIEDEDEGKRGRGRGRR